MTKTGRPKVSRTRLVPALEVVDWRVGHGMAQAKGSTESSGGAPRQSRLYLQTTRALPRGWPLLPPSPLLFLLPGTKRAGSGSCYVWAAEWKAGSAHTSNTFLQSGGAERYSIKTHTTIGRTQRTHKKTCTPYQSRTANRAGSDRPAALPPMLTAAPPTALGARSVCVPPCRLALTSRRKLGHRLERLEAGGHTTQGLLARLHLLG